MRAQGHLTELAARLQARAETLAFAESCTGGLLAKLATDLPGSSAWFERALVTYSNAAKHELLGVPPSVFETDGAVSEACVRAMAAGLIERSPAHWAVAVSGIAGPGGGSPGRPVGTVWISWAQRGGLLDAERSQFEGDRDAVREAAAEAALSGLLQRLRAAG